MNFGVEPQGDARHPCDGRAAVAQALLPVLLIGSLGLAPLLAENYTHLAGVILDSSGASVPGAMVSVVNEDTGLRRGTLSQPDGGYLVSSLQPGAYKITVRKPGFRTMIRFGVKLTEEQPARVDFRLVVGSIQETITVESSAPPIQTEDASVSTRVGREEIERLPADGRGLLGLLQLAPGLLVTPATRGESGQFTVNGQRPNTNYFTVDGASANSGVSGGGLPAQSTGGSLPGMTAFGSLDSLTSLDSLQELRVETSTSPAEFGRMPGAQISLLTRSGSNELHGDLLYAFRNEALDANNWFANQHGDPRAPLRLQDYSGALGGPLWRDHTFFFVSYEGMHLQEPFIWVQPVPSLAARQGSLPWAEPLLNLFPEPNGPDLGNGLAEWTGRTSRPARLDAGSARLDHTFSSRLTAFARYNNSPSSTEFGANPVNILDLRTQSLTVGFDLRARANWLIDLRLNAADASASSVWSQGGPTPAPPCSLEPVTLFFLRAPGICDSLVRLSIAGVGQVISGSEGRRTQTQFQAAPTVQWNPATHTIQFGADYRRLAPARIDANSALSILADTVGDLASTSPYSNYWNGTAPRLYASAVMREISLFAQDTWRIVPRLTASFGLRWEISPAPLPGLGTSVNFLNPLTNSVSASRQPLWQSTYANFAPRFGVAYQPWRGSSTVIRAGMGFYYDSSLSLAADVVNSGPLSVSQFTSARNLLSTTKLMFGFLPNLRLPLVKQWNASVEHAFSSRDVVTVGYVGSSGNDLIRREVGGPGSIPYALLLALATNDGISSYHALQAQYHRRLTLGLQVSAAYAWSHSIDNSSTDSGLYWAGSGLTPNRDLASSDFDVRHSFSAGFTYELPFRRRALLRGWAVDGTFRARSGFPINVLDAEQFQGITFENIFRPDLIGGQPIWINDPNAPGGRRINSAAFHPAPAGTQGTLGRNAIPGFGMSQMDLALRRDFFAGEQRSLQLRVEAYNALNHSNFADPIRFLASPLFGESNSMLNLMLGTGSPGSGLAPIFQAGGERSLRVVLRFRF